MRECIETYDWASTRLGLGNDWSQSLKTAISIVLAAPVPMVLLWGPDLTQIHNDAFSTSMGLSPPEGLGRSAREHWPELRSTYERVLRGECVRQPELGVSFGPVAGDSGGIGGVLLTYSWPVAGASAHPADQDAVAAAKRALSAEEALQDSRREGEIQRLRLAAVLEAMPAAVSFTDERGRVLKANKAHDRMWGVHPAMEGAEHYGLYPGRWAGTGRKVEGPEWAMSRALRGEIATGDMVEVDAPDGSKRSIILSAAPIYDEGGRLLGGVSASLDVTRQRIAEEALRESEVRQAFLLKLSDAINSLMDPAEVKTAAAETLGGHLGVAAAGYVEVEEGGQTLLAGGEFNDGRVRNMQGRYPISDCGMFGQILLRGEPVYVADYATDERGIGGPAAVQAAGIRSAAMIPLVKDGRLVAFFYGVDMVPRRWTKQEHALLQETTERTWAAVERARAESAMRQSEEQFRLLVGNVREYAIFEVDSEGKIRSWNPGAERLFGFSMQEMLGQDASSLLTRKDRQTRILEQEIRHAMAGMQQQDARWMVRKNGTRFWAQWITEPVRDKTGRVIGLAKVLRDETERMRSEEALRRGERDFNAIANLVPDLLWRSDHLGNPNWYNQRWYDYTGQTRQESVGVGFLDVIHPEDRENSQAASAEAVRKGEGVRLEHRMRGADGRYRWFLAQARPFRDENGKIIAWFGAATDIHEERMASNALKRSLAEKEELLKEVHHRVKNNLQIITSLLHLQARQIEDREILDLFNVALNRVQSIASIHELIYRSGSFTAVDFGAYVSALSSDFIRVYGAQDRISVNVEGDGASLELQRAVPFGLLLSELLSNVCKHAFPNGSHGKLNIRMSRSQGQLEMTVSDTGIGLPDDFNYKNSSSLGIFLVHSLARQLRASVEFTSGLGTSVHVQLPLALSQETEDGQDVVA